MKQEIQNTDLQECTPAIHLVTEIANAATQTDKTVETYMDKNNAFLESIFGEESAFTRPMVVSFAGNPATVEGSAWSGAVWTPDKKSPSPNANNYFSLATFHPDETGEYRRRKSQFSALHAIMLDDIGTKIPLERLTLPASWLLETSSGNFQAGYILAEPIQDAVTADGLMSAIINAGLCDPGAGGPTARLARLPEAVNGKRDPAFSCSLREWCPERRYSIEELVAGLQIDMLPVGRPKAIAKNQDAEQGDDSDLIFIPRPDENAVIAELRKRNLYKSPLGIGKHDITCPWVDTHTDGIDGGTAYFEPDDLYPLGGFKCLHGHCADRHIRDLLLFFNVEESKARMKPVIRVIQGEIHRIVDTAEQELAKAEKHYQRGNLIVTVCVDPSTRETCVRDISLPALVSALAGVATWEKYDARSLTFVRTDPPARHCSGLFDATSYRHMPILNGLARQPYLRSDGTLSTKAGYDPVTGMLGIFVENEFTIPEQPTKAEAEIALRLIEGLLEEFSFPKKSDLAAALSSILAASVRPSLSTAPMFHVRAPQASSGKSFLCELVTAFATPKRGSPTTFPKDDEECRKMLLAELLKAPAVIEFDNMTTDLMPHKSLCTALTSEHMTGRILGVSKTATVSTRTLFLSSGNNVGPVQDMTRRCVTINLDPACEVPAARTFKKPDLMSGLQRERGKYVSAALTIIRAWIVAGRPKAECKPLASYGDWSDLCRQPLLWLGQADPTESVFEAMQDDPDRETLGHLLDSWHACFGNTPAMVRDAVKLTEFDTENVARSDLRESLLDIAGERDNINRRRLGWWIKRHASRIVNGKRFVRVDGKRSAEAWKVEVVV